MQSLSGKDEAWWERFQDLLDDQMEWPSLYVFKFIAPQARRDQLTAVFGRHPVKVRVSRQGNYISVTARMEMHSSYEIIALYKAAAVVEGVILL